MTLKINLSPKECVVIGKARVENGGDRRCTLIITGSDTVLREKRLLREAEATTPMKRLYYVVQCMYLADSPDARASLDDLFHQVAREAIRAWPTAALGVARIGEALLGGNDYGALNEAHVLVEAEKGLMNAASEESGR